MATLCQISASRTDTDQALHQERLAAWRTRYVIETPEQEWLLEQAVVHSIRIDRCHEQEAVIRRNDQQRASLSWDDDRRDEAVELAAKLAKHPEITVSRLQRTRQGVEWMIEQWRALAALYQREGEWTELQVALAHDLTGIAAELRNPITNPSALIDQELLRLQRRLTDALIPLDAQERQATESGHPIIPSRALMNLRRYEATCRRHYQWALRQLTTHATAAASPEPVELPAIAEEDSLELALPADHPYFSELTGFTQPTFQNRHARRAAAKVERRRLV